MPRLVYVMPRFIYVLSDGLVRKRRAKDPGQHDE
jgi:hypothetical protein